MKQTEVLDCNYRKLCPQTWENLEETKNEKVRFCDMCRREVFYAVNKKEAVKLARNRKCVAFEMTEDENYEIQRKVADFKMTKNYVGRPKYTILLFEEELKNG